jgi:hypothetical protein
VGAWVGVWVRACACVRTYGTISIVSLLGGGSRERGGEVKGTFPTFGFGV